MPFLSDFTTSEHLLLLHQLFLTLNCAISQIGPALFPQIPTAVSTEDQIEQDMAQIMPYLTELTNASNAATIEADRLFQHGVQTVIDGAMADVPPHETEAAAEDVRQDLKLAMVDTVCDLNLRNTPEGQKLLRRIFDAEGNNGTFSARTDDDDDDTFVKKEETDIQSIKIEEQDNLSVKLEQTSEPPSIILPVDSSSTNGMKEENLDLSADVAAALYTSDAPKPAAHAEGTLEGTSQTSSFSDALKEQQVGLNGNSSTSEDVHKLSEDTSVQIDRDPQSHGNTANSGGSSPVLVDREEVQENSSR